MHCMTHKLPSNGPNMLKIEKRKWLGLNLPTHFLSFASELYVAPVLQKNNECIKTCFLLYPVPVTFWHILPLYTIGESRAVIWRWGIMASDGIQETVVGGHTHPPSPLCHRRAHAPLVGVWIEAFHGSQTWAPISASNCKQSGIL